MKIFVTGGAGFVGRHVSEFLINEGHQVNILDNISNSTKNNISKLVKNGASFVKGDITNYNTLLKSMSGIDFVIHLAARISVQESVMKPEITNLVNVTGTVNVLRSCVANKIPNVIAASSAAVYGKPEKMPLDENSPTNSISPYGASKIALEQYLKAFSNCYEINSIALRFFNIYGIGQSSAYAGVITKFMERISVNKPLVIFGDGKNTRDFVSIHDVVTAVSHAMKKIKGKKGAIYNIASGRSSSINELARMMISLSGKKLPAVHQRSKRGDVRHSVADITLAKKDLGFLPKIMLKDGIEDLMQRRL